jgi:hypothetical protein
MILVIIGIIIIVLIIIFINSNQPKQITSPPIFTLEPITSETTDSINIYNLSNNSILKPQIITSSPITNITVPITTTSVPSTSSPITTISVPSTSSPITTISVPSTSSPITTTSVPSIRIPTITTAIPIIMPQPINITNSPSIYNTVPTTKPPITTIRDISTISAFPTTVISTISSFPTTIDVSPITEVSTIILSSLYEFASHTFTNAGATGSNGPTLDEIRNEYKTEWSKQYINMINDDGIQLWTVPITGYYKINAIGAAGGGSSKFGKGRDIELITNLTRGEIIKILVGQTGRKTRSANGGGGGGTFVIRDSETPIIIAGGGGGSGQNNFEDFNSNASPLTSANNALGEPDFEYDGVGGADGEGGFPSFLSGGGGGLLMNGFDAYCTIDKPPCNKTDGGKSFINGGKGGIGMPDIGPFASGVGGFGGGGSSNAIQMMINRSGRGGGGGGGGGYSGGGGGGFDEDFGYVNGGGGGSYGITALTDNGAINSNHGKVIITFLSTTIPEIKEDKISNLKRRVQLELENMYKNDKFLRKKEIQENKELNRLLEYERITALQRENKI